MAVASLILRVNGADAQKAPRIEAVTISVTTGKPVNTFKPSQALGAGVDGYEKGDIPKIYTQANIKAMLTAGFKPLSYRLRTELGVQAWHWNPQGVWSDPARKQGYWTSSDVSESPLLISYGYNLPRRGSTVDQAGNAGYSRLDDGDTATFWKSNPYLDSHFTGEDNAKHAQWIIVDFGERRMVNAMRVLWGAPYATRYKVERWEGEDPELMNDATPGDWVPFPKGLVDDGRGGDALLRLQERAIAARYVRITLLEASGTAPEGATDVRDRLGFAVRELSIGLMEGAGRFHDAIQHGKSAQKQTVIYTSSTDPWHRASDKNPNTEQPGFDLIFKSGLTNGLPLLTPVALLYDTPDNAAAEIRFLKSRGYPVRQIEMGEEPDGQCVTPEDYGALYRQWADAIHKVNPALLLGGPGFQTEIEGWKTWRDAKGNASWMNRFLNYLRSQKRLADFNFFSFEWYPFDDVCAPAAPQLLQAPQLLGDVMRRLIRDGVPQNIPWIITEYGYSSFAGRAEVELPGALLNAEIVAQFLTLGGSAAYLYGYEPNTLIKEMRECDAWGNLALFLSDDSRAIREPLPTYYGAQLLTQQWAQPGDGVHEIYPATAEPRDGAGRSLVTAYTVHRPDGQWATLLINKDLQKSHSVRVRFRNDKTGGVSAFQGRVSVYQYSPRQYMWQANGKKGHPIRNQPPQLTIQHGDFKTDYTLPPYSLTVLRGLVR